MQLLSDGRPMVITKFDQVLLCYGHRLHITKSLPSVLRRYRCTAEKVFWVDQVCINQKDKDEIGRQVSIMLKIYKQAQAVFIWLGDHDETTEDGIAMAKYVADSKSGGAWSTDSISRFWLYIKPELSWDETWTPWLKLFSKKWWSRQWVVQEYVCARAHRFFCGDFEIPQKLL